MRSLLTRPKHHAALTLLACVAWLIAAGTAAAQPPGGQPLAEQVDLFTHIVSSAGWFFGPLLLVMSIALVTLIVLMALDLRMGVAVPPALVDEFTETVNRRQFKQAFELVRADNSFLARVLAAGMGRLQYGIEDAREAASGMVDAVKAGKEQLITYMGTVGTLGPLIGLVGTVYGMILAFRELGSNTAPRPEVLAEGISHALVVTLLGISLCVPAIFCHAFFRNRLITLTNDTALLADDLLTQMYHNSKKSAPATAPAPAPTAPPPPARPDPRGIRPME